jgi:hypothetical protein
VVVPANEPIGKVTSIILNSFGENCATIADGGNLNQKILAYQGIMEQPIPEAAKENLSHI